MRLRQKGFSLIELLIVVAIILIIAAIRHSEPPPVAYGGQRGFRG